MNHIFCVLSLQLESFRRPAFTELLDELGEVAESLELPFPPPPPPSSLPPPPPKPDLTTT